MTDTVTIAHADLHRLLNAASLFADDGMSLPVLNTVKLATVDGHLTATATNRYILGHVRVTPKDITGRLEALLPVASAAAIRATFKAPPPLVEQHGPAAHLTLTVGEKGLTVKGPAWPTRAFKDPVDITATYPLRPGKYPDIGRIIPDALKTDDEQPVGDPLLNPRLVATVMKAASIIAPHDQALLAVNGTARATVWATVNRDLVAAVMPSRRSDEDGRDTITPWWQS